MTNIYVTAPFTDPNGDTHEPDTVVDADRGVASHAKFYGVGRPATDDEIKTKDELNRAAEQKRQARLQPDEKPSGDTGDGEQTPAPAGDDAPAQGEPSTKTKTTSRRAGTKGEENT